MSDMTEWDVPGLSVRFMGPVMAMSLNGIRVAGLVGKAVPCTFVVFALARDGFGPAALARTSRTTGVPTGATICVVVLTVVFLLFPAATGGRPVEVYYWYATIATLCMVVAYAMTSILVFRRTFRPGSPFARWEAVLPALGLGYLAYVYLVQGAGQEPPYTYFPWMAGAWCLLGAIVIFAAPRLAERIGARLTTEDVR